MTTASQAALPFARPRAVAKAKRKPAAAENRESAAIIAAEAERYGGEQALAVIWARGVLAGGEGA
jgi:hypothetical protein